MNNNSQVFIITGGASGLGLATAKVLRQSGHRVVIFDINENDQIKVDQNNLQFFKIDITNRLAIREAMVNIVENWGRIDGVVNCAAIALVSFFTEQEEESPIIESEHLEALFKVNVLGTFNMIKEYVTLQQKYLWKKGVIVNTSSITSVEGGPGFTSYSITKSAINGMTRPMARELAKFGIRVVAILPGGFVTSMVSLMSEEKMKGLINAVPLGRLGKPYEFGLFVKSIIDNDYLTGVNLRIDGGLVGAKL